jgi:hypothetical protein
MPKQSEYRDYFYKSLVWWVENFLFGTTPILFMLLVYLLSEHKLGLEHMEKLIHEGNILFVCFAMVGGVLIDHLQSDFTWRGSQVFIIFIAPLAILGGLCLVYLFVVMNTISSGYFDISSVPTVFVLIFSMAYCIPSKINLLIQEETCYE